MNKTILINSVAEKTNLKRIDVAKIIDAVFKSIEEGLKKDAELVIIGFGTFRVIAQEERDGINPKTLEKIKIKAKNTVKFRPGKVLKDHINRLLA